MREQNPAARPFDIRQIEGDIGEAVEQRPPHIQAVEPPPGTPPPSVREYVSHQEAVTKIGNLSAKAIVKEYEVTKKEIEAMEEVVRDMVQRCERLATSASSMLKDIKTTAMQYRESGKRIFNEIESCSNATDEVRRLCDSFRDRIASKTGEVTA